MPDTDPPRPGGRRRRGARRLRQLNRGHLSPRVREQIEAEREGRADTAEWVAYETRMAEMGLQGRPTLAAILAVKGDRTALLTHCLEQVLTLLGDTMRLDDAYREARYANVRQRVAFDMAEPTEYGDPREIKAYNNAYTAHMDALNNDNANNAYEALDRAVHRLVSEGRIWHAAIGILRVELQPPPAPGPVATVPTDLLDAPSPSEE